MTVGLAGSSWNAVVPSVSAMTDTTMTDSTTEPMTSPVPLGAPSKPRGVRRVLLESGYNLSALPVSLAAFVLVVVFLAVGVGLSILIGGVLLLTLGVTISRGFALLERLRMRTMLGRDASTPVYLRARPDDGF